MHAETGRHSSRLSCEGTQRTPVHLHSWCINNLYVHIDAAGLAELAATSSGSLSGPRWLQLLVMLPSSDQSSRNGQLGQVFWSQDITGLWGRIDGVRRGHLRRENRTLLPPNRKIQTPLSAISVSPGTSPIEPRPAKLAPPLREVTLSHPRRRGCLTKRSTR